MKKPFYFFTTLTNTKHSRHILLHANAYNQTSLFYPQDTFDSFILADVNSIESASQMGYVVL